MQCHRVTLSSIATEGGVNVTYTELRREYKYYRGRRECNANDF